MESKAKIAKTTFKESLNKIAFVAFFKLEKLILKS